MSEDDYYFLLELLLCNDKIHEILPLLGRIGKPQGLEFPYISPAFFWKIRQRESTLPSPSPSRLDYSVGF